MPLVEYERVYGKEAPTCRGDDRREDLRERIEAEVARRVPCLRTPAFTLNLTLTVSQASWLAGVLEEG